MTVTFFIQLLQTRRKKLKFSKNGVKFREVKLSTFVFIFLCKTMVGTAHAAHVWPLRILVPRTHGIETSRQTRFLSMHRVLLLYFYPIKFVRFDNECVNCGLPAWSEPEVSLVQTKRIVGSGDVNDHYEDGRRTARSPPQSTLSYFSCALFRNRLSNL